MVCVGGLGPSQQTDSAEPGGTSRVKLRFVDYIHSRLDVEPLLLYISRKLDMDIEFVKVLLLQRRNRWGPIYFIRVAD